MKKAILKTSGMLLVVGLAFTAMLFGCRHKTEPKTGAEQQTEKVTITVTGDANVTVNAPVSFEVAKGSKWGDIKANVNVTYKEGYAAAGFKLENASGQDLTDDYAFNESKTVFAVSKKQMVTITILGDSNVKSIEPKTFPVDKGSKWGDIKGNVNVTYNEGYEAAGFKLENASGQDLTDDYVFNINIAVFAVSKKQMVTITVAGDANVTVNAPASFEVAKGSKWCDIKGNVNVTYKEGYEAAGFKLENASGQDLTDGYAFNESKTVFAVSKQMVTITVTGDANVTVNARESFEVAKGSKWGDIKGNVNVTYKEGYEAAGFKLENASGQDLTDDYAFNESKTVFAVSNQIVITITVKGDERTDISSGAFIKVDYAKTWQDIKSQSQGKVGLKVEWQGGDYAIYEWRLDGETGEKLTDGYKVKTDITVYAVTNYAKFNISNNKISLKSEGRGYTGGSPKGKIIIPENITEIENGTWPLWSYNCKGAFSYCTGLTSVSFPASLTSIGEYAFYGCTGLTSVVNLSSCTSLTSIGKGAFEGCTGLTSAVNLSSCTNLTSIGENAFYGCKGLTSVSLSRCTSLTSIGKGAFEGCTGLTSAVNLSSCTSLTSIGESAFRSCSGLTSVSLSGCTSLKSIGGGAFEGCTGLTSVVNLSGCTSLKSIGKYAFYGCTGLTSVVNLSSCTSLTSIGESAFRGCSGLTSVSLSGCTSLTSIGKGAFSGCKGLTSVSFPASLTSIDESAFSGCKGLTSVSFPASLTSIGESAFRGCSGLTNVSLSSCTSLTSIGKGAFSGCKGLTSVSFPASLTSIDESAFSGCKGLTSVSLSSCTSLTSIGGAAFRDCTDLTNVSFPASLTSIGESAFDGCTGLMSVSFPASLTSIGKRAFRSCRGLTSVTVDNGNSKYKSVDNVVYTKDGTTLVFAAGGLTSVNILPSVTSIGNGAFYGCTGITSVDLSSCTSLTSIGASAFYGCIGITSVSFPASLTSIGDGAFSGCRGLTSVSFPASLTSIGDGAFGGCSGLTSVSLSSCTSLTSIGEYAFSVCIGLTSVSFPASLTKIGQWAFSDCDNLTSATFADAAGWAVYNDNKYKNRDSYIQQSDLANPATAAKYLRDNYNKWWKKN